MDQNEIDRLGRAIADGARQQERSEVADLTPEMVKKWRIAGPTEEEIKIAKEHLANPLSLNESHRLVSAILRWAEQSGRKP